MLINSNRNYSINNHFDKQICLKNNFKPFPVVPNINFGVLKTIGRPKKISPFKELFDILYSNTILTQKELIIKSKFKQKSLELLPAINDSRGIMHPTTANDANGIINTSTPPTISNYYRLLNNKVRKTEVQNWQKANKIFFEKYKTNISSLAQNINDIDSNKSLYVKKLIQLNTFLAKGTKMQINLESDILKNIAESNEPVIFSFNHPDFPNDTCCRFGIIAELYKLYSKAGNTQSCPKMKHLLSGRIIDAFPPDLSKIFEKIQGVKIDSSPIPSLQRSKKNESQLKSTINGFIEGENHILLTPEGGRGSWQNLSLQEKFQSGIGKIVLQALNSVEKVKVINIGINLNNGGIVDAGVNKSVNPQIVHIGKPLIFKKGKNNEILVNKGNLSSSDKQENEFYSLLSQCSEDETKPIMLKGKEVPLNIKGSKEEEKAHKIIASRLIAGIICNDLNICVKNSRNKYL